MYRYRSPSATLLSVDLPSEGMGPSPLVIRTIVSISTTSSACRDPNCHLVADLTDNLGYGAEKRRQGNLDILAGRLTFRYASESLAYSTGRGIELIFFTTSDAFKEMLDSVNANGHSFQECTEALKQSESYCSSIRRRVFKAVPR
jgi:hypothetical protein